MLHYIAQFVVHGIRYVHIDRKSYFSPFVFFAYLLCRQVKLFNV